MHHSDRGSPYLSIKYTERLAEAINGLFKAEANFTPLWKDQTWPRSKDKSTSGKPGAVHVIAFAKVS